MFESLETRRHMSVTAADIHDTLYVWGDQYNNGISVSKSGNELVVKEYQGAAGYQEIFSVLDSAVNAVRIYGYDGMDTIQVADNVTKTTTVMGGRGADWIQGGGGHNTLWGQGDWAADPSFSHRPANDDNAADVLVSGVGTNVMYGQGGNDTLIFQSAAAAGKTDAGLGGSGNDTFEIGGTRDLVAIGDTGNDTFKPHASNPKATILGGGGTDTVDYANFGKAVYVRNDSVTKSGPKDALADGPRRHSIDASVENIKGTQLNDYLINAATNGKVYGQDGHDLLYGSSGNNVIYGGNGNDAISGEAGNDTIFGGDGDDSIMGATGNDYIYGGDGHDTIYGGSGNDEIRGGNHNDHLYGESGTDWIYGDSGTNLLVGGADSDFLVSKNGSWFDIVFGGNTNGSGNAGAIDVAVIDRIWANNKFNTDTFIGVEVVSF